MEAALFFLTVIGSKKNTKPSENVLYSYFDIAENHDF